MKKISIYFLAVVGILSCSKDNDIPSEKELATPILSWKANGIDVNYLELSITISSDDNLPSGKIDFKVDNINIDVFTPIKGTQIYISSFSFKDTNEHAANLIYSFTDGRTAINKTFKIKKIETENLEKSSKENWEDI